MNNTYYNRARALTLALLESFDFQNALSLFLSPKAMNRFVRVLRAMFLASRLEFRWDSLRVGLVQCRFDPSRSAVTSETAMKRFDRIFLALLIIFSAFHFVQQATAALPQHEIILQYSRDPSLYSVAFSPDGKTIVSRSDRVIHILDPETGKLLRTLHGHSRTVTAAIFTPDGSKVASASEDGTVRLWDAASGRTLLRLTGHTSNVTSMAISPDGQFLISGSHDGTVKSWAVATGKLRFTYTGHSNMIDTVAYNPDGKTFACAGGEWDGTGSDSLVRICNAETGATLQSLEQRAGWVRCLAFSPDGSKLVFSGTISALTCWDSKAGKQYELGPDSARHDSPVTGVSFSSNGQMLTSVSSSGAPTDGHGGNDNTLRLWTTQKSSSPRVIPLPSGAVGVAIAPDDKTVAVASEDGAIRLWAADTGKLLRTIRLPNTAFLMAGVVFSRDGKMLFLRTQSHQEMWFDVAKGELLGNDRYSARYGPEYRQNLFGQMGKPVSMDSTGQYFDMSESREWEVYGRDWIHD